MNDETEILEKLEPPEGGKQKTSTVTVQTGNSESQFANVSVRAWIALIVVVSICGMSAFSIEVKEPLYTLGGLIVGFYFGQKTK